MSDDRKEISDEESQAHLAKLRAQATNGKADDALLPAEPEPKLDLPEVSEAPLNKQLNLDFPQDITVSPTEFARTSIFGMPADKRGARKVLKNQSLSTRNEEEIQIYFSGEELGPREETVWLAIIRMFRKKNVGDRLVTTIKKILDELGMPNTGGEKGSRQVLIKRLVRLAEAEMRIHIRRYDPVTKRDRIYTFQRVNLLNIDYTQDISDVDLGTNGKAIDKLSLDIAADAPIVIYLDPRGAKLFENVSYQPWEVRLALKNEGAELLLSYICSHVLGGVHKVSLQDLKNWFNYSAEIRFFRKMIEDALKLMVEHGIIEKSFEYKYKDKAGNPQSEVQGWLIEGRGQDMTLVWKRTDKVSGSLPNSGSNGLPLPGLE